jgi:predicted flap endonuclease-1-like 5' DNA nuclease
MASFLYLVAGVVIGLVAGWLLRGSRDAAKRPAETTDQVATAATPAAQRSPRHAAPSITKDGITPEGSITKDVTTPEGSITKDEEPHSSTHSPAATTVTEHVAEVDDPATDEKPDTITDTEPAAPVTPVATPVTPVAAPATPLAAPAEPVAVTERVTDADAEPVAGSLNGAAPVPAPRSTPDLEPVTLIEPTPPAVAEPLAAVPGADEAEAISPAPAPVAMSVTEPDDLTKIVGIGPKIAMALAVSGITTFPQLADTDIATLRTAITSAGLRLAPSLATWPEQAKKFSGDAG